MKQFKLKQPYLRWFRREASDKEQEDFYDRAADIDPIDELTEPMHEVWTALLNDQPAEQQPHSALAERIIKRYPAEAEVPIRKMPWNWLRIAAAAVVVAIIAITAVYLSLQVQDSKPASQSVQRTDKAPGHEGALLTLADGTVMVLDSAKNGELAQQEGTTVRLADGNLVYDAAETNAATYNTMSTPRGRKFKLTLPDGTRVWLNAASSLTYPTAFTGNERSVELKGEAYFEVVKDPAKPFRVKTDEQLVEVLGTRFNVHAYAEEKLVATTLLSGKVSVKPKQSATPLLMEPGFQAMSDRETGVTQQVRADSLDVMAWKDGVFRFRNTPLAVILQQLERWYDVQVEGPVPPYHYTGVISRESSLLKVLQWLEVTGNARFQIDLRSDISNQKDRITIIK